MAFHPDKRDELLSTVSSTSLGASINYPFVILPSHQKVISIYAKWTGATVDGTFSLEANNDPSDNPDANNWIPIVSTAYAASGPGHQIWNISNVGFPFVRLVFTRTSGTGTLTVFNYSIKGY